MLYTDEERTAVRLLSERVIPVVNRLRSEQERDGSIAEPGPRHRELVDEVARRGGDALERLDRGHQAAALRADLASWLAAGLDSRPEFDRTRDAFVPPTDGALGVFIGPALMTNAAPPVKRGFEAFAVRRQEPRGLAALCTAYPHPKNICQATRLLVGSDGAARGNCVVFFPENIPARRELSAQAFALFFFSKFRRVHETFAVPAARAVLTEDTMLEASNGLSPEDCYEARSLWGYLHDYFHHQGPRPFDEHIAVKTNWFVGLLEEIKVDCQTVLACVDDEIPLAREQIAMVLLERMFRYPLEPNAERVFDSGTGVLLYTWLREHGGVRRTSEGRLSLSLPDTYAALRSLVATILEIEANAESDDEYRATAKAFVRRFLPEGAEGERYAFTPDQEILRRYRQQAADLPILSFGVAEL